MFSKNVTVQNATGLHARPASQLTQLCKKFPETIKIIGNGKEVDPKSVIGLLSAGLKKDTELEVQVTGDNEEAVCNEIVDFIANLSE